MPKKQPLTELEPSYFQLQAYWGATKHAGGLHATNELITRCHITPHQHILDIGCGAGTTPTHLAKTHHTTVTALDLNPQMTHWTHERATREQVADHIHLIRADAQHPPFKTPTSTPSSANPSPPSSKTNGEHSASTCA